MNKAIAVLKAHSPAILAFGLAFYAQFATTIAAWITAHPKYASWGTVLTFVIGYYMKSPLSAPAPAQTTAPAAKP